MKKKRLFLKMLMILKKNMFLLSHEGNKMLMKGQSRSRLLKKLKKRLMIMMIHKNKLLNQYQKSKSNNNKKKMIKKMKKRKDKTKTIIMMNKFSKIQCSLNSSNYLLQARAALGKLFTLLIPILEYFMQSKNLKSPTNITTKNKRIKKLLILWGKNYLAKLLLPF